MESLKLDAASTALILIDLQNGIVGRQTSPYAASEVVEKGATLARNFRDKKALVVYVRVDLADFLQLPADVNPMDPNNPPPAIASELAPESGVQPTDLIITKRHWGAFSGTNLEEELHKAGIKTVVIGGIATNIGVESTARNAAGLGFAVVLVEDACTTFDAASQAFAFEKIFPRLGRVRNTAEVIEALA
jgi:nicotinamidase-related amidase